MTSLFATHSQPPPPLLTIDTTTTLTTNNNHYNTNNNNSSSSSFSSKDGEPINRLKLVVSTLGAHGSILLRKRDTSITHTDHITTTNTSHTTHATADTTTNNDSSGNDGSDSNNSNDNDNSSVVTVPSKLVPDSWVETKRSKSPLTLTQGVLRVTSSNCEKGHNYEDYDVIQ